MRQLLLAGTAILGFAAATPASASLSVLNSFTGQVDVSTDGCGSVSQTCTLTANVPAGGVVQAAYLYTTTYDSANFPGISGSFGGSPIAGYTPLGLTGGPNGLQAGRYDVTSIVSSAVNGGPGGGYSFTYTENDSRQDGGALVVVYSQTGLPTATVAIMDGFSATTGDSATISFANPLSPSSPGFRAEMRLGIGYSFDGVSPGAPTSTEQVSRITVNGLQLTNVAGHCDDAVDASCANGSLITVGDDADPFSAVLPTVGGDHEKYDLKTLIPEGSTQIGITTINPSNNDNIFLAVFAVSGEARVAVTPTPEPASMALLSAGLLGLGALRRRRR